MKLNRIRIGKLFAGTLLAGAMILSGCSSAGDPIDEPDGAGPEVLLSAGLTAVTRAVIGNDAKFTASIGGWESDGAADYTKNVTWASTSTVSSKGTNTLSLTPVRYYSQNGSVKTYMKAWYPGGTPQNGVVKFAGTSGFSGNGTDDILIASAAVGSALDAGQKSFTFRHLTTQLKFTVKCDALFEASNTTLRSITIKNVGVPTGLDVSAEKLVCNVQALGVTGIDGNGKITQTAALVGAPVMIDPFKGKTIYIDVTTNEVTYHDVPVTISDANAVAGKAYTIALDFKSFAVTAQASVTDWVNTGTGSGVVEEEWNQKQNNVTL